MEEEIWTVKRILDWIEGYLRGKGDANPRLSAQWLVSEALGVSRMQLYLDPERPLNAEERATLRDYTRRRGAGEPLQYITGTTDFRFITVQVRHGVLIPRPETEVLVSEALSQLDAVRRVKQERWAATERAFEADAAGAASDAAGGDVVDAPAVPGSDTAGSDTPDSASDTGDAAPDTGDAAPATDDAAPATAGTDTTTTDAPEEPQLLVADLCTGSGCIACSIATEIPYAEVVATDIDPNAVDLARTNAENLGVSDRVQIVECDLGEGIDDSLMGRFHLVISNPPYIPTDVLASLDEEVAAFESSLALDGGADGLDTFRRILPFALRALAPQGVLALELHETCLDDAAQEALASGFDNVRVANDLAGRKRVLVAQKG